MILYLKNPPQLYFANVRFIPEFTDYNEGGSTVSEMGDNIDVHVEIRSDQDNTFLLSFSLDLKTKSLKNFNGKTEILTDQRMLEIGEQLYEIMSYAEENKATVNMLD